MPFLSFAQNFEDVMLWRALKHIKAGFYIDVGAWSPGEHSVTRLVSENGWCGINIEPNPEYFAQLVARRRRDINLAVAVGDRCASVEMHMISGTGLSTCDRSIASGLVSHGWKADVKTIELTTLSAIWSQYVPKHQDVHFLKIDVEGFEKAVISGNDWVKNRPWIVVIEAISPLTRADSYFEWEAALVSAGYVFCYEDGLNRYYVSEERSNLIAEFRYPPNVFDEFSTAHGAVTGAEVIALRRSLSDLLEDPEQVSDAVGALLLGLTKRLSALEAEMREIRASTSWRMTEPLRLLADFRWTNGKCLNRTRQATWQALMSLPKRVPHQFRKAASDDSRPISGNSAELTLARRT